MNETFNVDEEEFDENQLKNYIDNNPEFKSSKEKQPKIEDQPEQQAKQRRESVYLEIENNFDIVPSNKGCDYLLENELIPECLLDDCMNAETSSLTIQPNKHLTEANSSILDVDEMQLFSADGSPSLNNLNWLNSKIEDEKSQFMNRTASNPALDDAVIQSECRLLLNYLVLEVVSLMRISNSEQLIRSNTVMIERLETDEANSSHKSSQPGLFELIALFILNK
jgi:hypothetical protein